MTIWKHRLSIVGRGTDEKYLATQLTRIGGVIYAKKITLTVNELSELLAVSTATIYKMAKRNEIPHFKILGKIMFNRELIEAWTKGEYVHQQNKEVM